MGTILRRRYEFSRLSSIREAYSLAFDSDSTQVDAALKDDSLDTLSTVRNLLVHKAAIVDEDYLYRAKGLKGLPNGKLGKLLLLDGETVVKLVKPALAQGARLLEAVDGWLHKHKS
jgi:hypothetical protein